MFRRRKFSTQQLSRFFVNAKYLDIETKFSFSTIIATWFYVGKFPIMPGTIGSIATYPIYYLILVRSSSYSDFSTSLLFVVFFIWIIGLYAISKFQKATNSFDNQVVVVDEVVGQLLTFAISYEFLDTISRFLYVKIGISHIQIINLSFILGLIAFRFFDIKKPFFITYIDRKYKNAFGVMLDDIVAAFFASAILYLLYKCAIYIR